MWAWRCYRSMSSSTPRETSGALPEWNGIQKTDLNMIIDPILQQFRAVTRAALQEHMNLVTSQYMTGYARASRESGIGAAMPMDPPNLSDISDVNPVTTPDQTPKTKSRLAAYAGIVPSPTSFSSVASLAKRGYPCTALYRHGLGGYSILPAKTNRTLLLFQSTEIPVANFVLT